jgi:glycosyltransferase involved in cell wall biosynthesis
VYELTILMPVFNERDTVETAIAEVLGTELPFDGIELLIVDDGSTDGTREILRNGTWPENVRIIEHERNKGKGAAVITALDNAKGKYSTILDADLEYSPTSLPALMEPLREGWADAVYGTRAFQSHSAYSFWYVAGNKFVTFAANLLYNAWLSDIMTCHKIMSTDLFRALELKESGFAIEPEITARLLTAGQTIFEVPIPYRARKREAGKKLTSRDGLRVLRTLAKCRFKRAANVPDHGLSKPASSPRAGSLNLALTDDDSTDGTDVIGTQGSGAAQHSESAGTT